ncbi:MAG: GNAT family protein [Candidatus Eisenbacteria bacterium]|nr:GNAT family protein [Candidatus Eisenbacteria bacterium]
MRKQESDSSGSVFLSGRKVYLRPMEKDDLPLLRKWTNDAEIRELIAEVSPTSSSGMEEYLEKIRRDSNRVWFVIVLRENDRIIGECGLLRMFHPWRTTDLSIFIGDKKAWGKGYGTEALYLLLDYAFGSLNFHRVAFGVVGSNKQAIRFYEKAGFKREGVQRDGYYFDHAYQDFVMMSMLEDEFRAKYSKTPKKRK